MTNKLQNTRIEFHILQSFPVSCLNRDDVGSPKSAMIGGTQRARVSSQCWKRAIRLAMHDYCGVQTASRTRLVQGLIADACTALGATTEQALACGEAAAKALTKTVKDGESDTLFFISKAEANAFAEYFKANAFDAEKAAKELLKVIKSNVNTVMDGVDIALFGRMAASAPEVNVEAAASVAHAISTHKVASKVEFFTAVDDVKVENDLQGSGHMGSLEFNSATYYRYVSLDLGQLLTNLGGDASLDLSEAIEAFTKALYLAIPSARQTTMTASTIWDYARVLIRKGQRIQASFEKAVTTSKDTPTILAASKVQLKDQLDRTEKLSGSLYGKIASFEFGENPDFSIDDLAAGLSAKVRELQAQ